MNYEKISIPTAHSPLAVRTPIQNRNERNATKSLARTKTFQKVIIPALSILFALPCLALCARTIPASNGMNSMKLSRSHLLHSTTHSNIHVVYTTPTLIFAALRYNNYAMQVHIGPIPIICIALLCFHLFSTYICIAAGCESALCVPN